VDADLYKDDGSLKMRKRRHKRRQTATSSGARQVTLRGSITGSRISAPEREVLSQHLHSSLIGETGAYEKADITCGRNYIRECLNSIDPSNIEAEAATLADF